MPHLGALQQADELVKVGRLLDPSRLLALQVSLLLQVPHQLLQAQPPQHS